MSASSRRSFPGKLPRRFVPQSASLAQFHPNREIPYFCDYISDSMLESILSLCTNVEDIPGLLELGSSDGLESSGGLAFLCQLYDVVKIDLRHVLNQRTQDRAFIDQRTRACSDFNNSLGRHFLSPEYETVIGHEDAKGRTVVGPRNDFYCKRGYGETVAPIPDFLQGYHVTLFGPPDDAKLSINAMNAYHRKLPDEPEIVSTLLDSLETVPKWGADDEDSKTPLRSDLVEAGKNLSGCIDGSLYFDDVASSRRYELLSDKLSVPIKRIPGLALPTTFLFYHGQPLPLHLYDFALHLFRHWNNCRALSFYIPKLESEEEAAYVHKFLFEAERLIQGIHPSYVIGTIKVFIVLENPRAIFRVNEIMDALYPYFAGASLGWHDYLASTARLFKEDPNYRMPVKADPNIVIKHIAASHYLLADVVGSRGGLKIGGMYGVLPVGNDLHSDSFQVTIKGFIKVSR
jgi:malate synthase